MINSSPIIKSRVKIKNLQDLINPFCLIIRQPIRREKTLIIKYITTAPNISIILGPGQHGMLRFLGLFSARHLKGESKVTNGKNKIVALGKNFFVFVFFILVDIKLLTSFILPR